MKKILTLVIDGLGESEKTEGNALKSAIMPNYNKLLETYPHSKLEASGEAVGVREGQPGNSEVGFKSLGAGRVLRQRSSFINEFVDKDSLATNGIVKSAIEYAKKHKSTIHIMGLMSDGGIISSIKDTVKIIEFLKTQDVKVVIDVIADGKDSEANGLINYIEMLKVTDVPIASVCGRSYALDTEGNWDKIKVYYDLVRNGVGLKAKDINLALTNCYKRKITDDMLPPIIVEENKQLKNNDVIIWTNYDAESSKEILIALTNPGEITDFEAVALDNLKVLLMYPVDPKVDATVLIDEVDDPENNLGSYFGKLELTQSRISLKQDAEMVSYYFNGEEDRKIPKCLNYALDEVGSTTREVLENGLVSITKQIQKSMEKDTDFILAYMSLVDRVGHTGNLDETVHALEVFDECLGKILEYASLNFYTVVITSTHGNVEEMLREENMASTVNTTNKVPFIITDSKIELMDGALTDVAPTVLSYMDIGVPESMNNSKILIKE